MRPHMATPLLLGVLLIGGCAPTLYTRPGSSVADFDAQKARCDYETSAATQQVDYGYRTTLGQAFDQALRQHALMKKCLVANGWREEPR